MSKKKNLQPDELKSSAADGDPAPARKVVANVAKPQAAAPAEGVDWKESVLPLLLGLLCAYLPYKVEPNIRDLFQLPKQLIMAEGAAWLVAIAGALALAGRSLRLPRTPMLWPGLVLMLAIGGGVWIAPSQTGGVLSIFARMDAHRWVSAAVIFLVTLIAVTRPKHLWYIIGGNLIGGLLVSLIGIGEQHNIRGLLPNPHWNLITMPGSTFGNRNMAGQEIAAVMPAAYAILALCVRWVLTRRLWQGLALGATTALSLLTLLYFLLLTITRSAWLGAGLGVLVAATLLVAGVLLPARAAGGLDDAPDPAPDAAPKSSGMQALFGASLGNIAKVVAGLGLTIFVIVAVADHFRPKDTASGDDKNKMSVPELIKSFADSKANHYRWRLGMAESTVVAIQKKPLGGGAGNWRVIYPQYVTQREKNEMFNIAKQPIRAHNDFLQFGAEFGVHGLLALLTLLAMAAWLTLRAVRKAAADGAGDQDDRVWLALCALASMASLVAICGDAMASFPLQLPGPTFLFALNLATIAAAESILYGRGFFGEGERHSVPNPQWLGGSVLAVGLLALKFLGPIYLVPGDVNLDTYRTMSVEQAREKGLHQRWLVAELGFTDGRALQKHGRAQAGLVAIQRAIALNPDDFQNHFIEGLNLNSLGRTKDAIASIENSLKLYPNLLNAWVNLAMFNRRLGDDKKMNEAIDKALELKPDELIALNVRAAWLEEKSKFDEELKLLDPQVKPYAEYRKSANWPQDDGGQLLGAWKTALGHLVTAARKEQKWPQLAGYLKLLYDEPVANDGRPEEEKDKEKMTRAADLADVLAKAGVWQEALPQFQAAAELAKAGYPEHKRNYAHALLHVGKYAEATQQMRVAMQVGMTKEEAATFLEEWIAAMPDKQAEVQRVREQVLGKAAAPAAAPDQASPSGGDAPAK